MFERGLALTLLATAFAVAGCAAASPDAGDVTALRGKLVLKGNVPFARPTLIVAEGDHWELENTPSSAIQTLQNKTVVAKGIVIRPARSGMLLPVLRVESIHEVEPGPGSNQD